jgi:hypothetical protein
MILLLACEELPNILCGQIPARYGVPSVGRDGYIAQVDPIQSLWYYVDEIWRIEEYGWEVSSQQVFELGVF